MEKEREIAAEGKEKRSKNYSKEKVGLEAFNENNGHLGEKAEIGVFNENNEKVEIWGKFGLFSKAGAKSEFIFGGLKFADVEKSVQVAKGRMYEIKELDVVLGGQSAGKRKNRDNEELLEGFFPAHKQAQTSSGMVKNLSQALEKQLVDEQKTKQNGSGMAVAVE